ncbi:MAG TPA: carboxypeptidase regulatory-like domain-containing protein [Candidatus Hydrogenedentes bacterium]|nr:carboxypeptidase regulatory-like domain-containing protein [Candidatus Hydrogenedentota bacterium]
MIGGLRFKYVLLALAVLIGYADAAGAQDITLRGTVTNVEGQPVAGARVWAGQFRAGRATRTDEQGNFKFEGLYFAPMEVVALAEGYSFAGWNGLPLADQQLKLVLTPERRRMEIRITDAAFTPLPGAWIRALSPGGFYTVTVEDYEALGFPPLRADDDGVITIDMLPPVDHARAVVGHPRYPDTAVDYLPVRADRRNQIQLEPGKTLRGRVTDGGRGIPGMRVRVFQPAVGGSVVLAETCTDPEGYYALRVFPGSYYAACLGHGDRADPEPVPVDLSEENKTVNFSLPETYTLRGIVQEESGKPVSLTRLVFRRGDLALAEALSDPRGRYALRVGVKEGSLQIQPPPGLRTRELPVIPVRFESVREIEVPPVVLLPLPVITGRIRLPEGMRDAPLALVTSQTLEPTVRAVTDTEGNFRIALGYQPEDNRASFRVEHALRMLRRDFTVNLDQRGDLELVLDSFEPALEDRPPIPGQNNLKSKLGKPASPLECSRWFNIQPEQAVPLKDRVTVITFWGWFDDSPQGRDRLYEMQALHDLYQGVDDVVILTVHDASEDAESVDRFLRQQGIRFPVGLDAEPSKTFSAYGIQFIPETVVVDRKGILRYDRTEGRLLELIKSLRRER